MPMALFDHSMYCHHMDLKLEFYQATEDVTTIVCDGELDNYTAPRLRELYLDLMRQGHRRFIVDLERLEYISSPGVGTLVGLLKRTTVRRKAGENTLVLVMPEGRVRRIFRMTGLDRVFPIRTTIGEALPLMYEQQFSLSWPEGRQRQTTSNGDWFYIRIYATRVESAHVLLANIIDLTTAHGIRIVFQSGPRARRFSELAVRMAGYPSSQSTLQDQLSTLFQALQHAQGSHEDPLSTAKPAATAALNVFAEVRKSAGCILQIGSVLLVKSADSVLLRNLDEFELERFEIIPDLFCDPKAALAEFQDISGQSTVDSHRSILLIGSRWPRNIVRDQARMAGLVVRQRAFYPHRQNWETITPLVRDPRLVAAIIKLDASEYTAISGPEYEPAANQLFGELSKVPHVVFVPQSIALPKRHPPNSPMSKKPVSTKSRRSASDKVRATSLSRVAGQTASARAAAILRKHSINVMPFETERDMRVLAAEFLDDVERNLLFRIYLPAGRLYAAEAGKMLSLFQEWLGTASGRSVRLDEYSTSAGRMYQFFGDSDMQREELREQFDGFQAFLDKCLSESRAAVSSLLEAGVGRAAAERLVSRYSREIRRLQLDLRQELEVRVLAIRHSLEAELVDIDNGFTLPWTEISNVVESMIPDVIGVVSVGASSTLSSAVSVMPVTVNLNQQVISAVQSTVVQNIQGTVHLGSSAKEVLEIVRQYGDSQRSDLEAAVYELEDPDSGHSTRFEARQRLKAFLFKLGGRATDIACGVLESYLESKILRL